jgi:hypothetical protein
MTNKRSHQIIGVLSLIFLGLYLCVLSTENADRWQRVSESFLRLAVLLGVIWLAWDDLSYLPRWLYFMAPIILLAVLVFRNVAPIVILILVPLWLGLKLLKFITQPLPPQHRGPKAK